jgi:hypothetical protein
MNETSERSRLPTVESCARRDARWSSVDVFAEWTPNLIACAIPDTIAPASVASAFK